MNIEVDTKEIIDPELVEVVKMSARKVNDSAETVSNTIDNLNHDLARFVNFYESNRKWFKWGVRIVFGSLIVFALSAALIAISFTFSTIFGFVVIGVGL